MQYLLFSQSKLSKRFQIQTIEISNFIVASLDIRFNFSNESKSENSQIWSFMVIFSTPKWSLFHFIVQFFSIRCRILRLKFQPEIFPKQQKAWSFPVNATILGIIPLSKNSLLRAKFNPKMPISRQVVDLIKAMPY